ncbi:MAG: PKD domain-containing protein [Thermoplasmata archaeon]
MKEMKALHSLAVQMAVVALTLPMIPPIVYLSGAPAEESELPWFLDDVRPPLNPPPGFVMPGAGARERLRGVTWPDYSLMTVTDEQLQGPAQARTVHPLIMNFSLSLSFGYDATVAQFNDMAGGLRRFADLVYDYTDGQFYINRFDMYNNRVMWNTANIHVLDQSMYRANANLGGYYYGGIIQIGRDAWGQPWDSAMGAIILAHEMGHYAFMLPDEYIEHPWGDETLCDSPAYGTCIMSDPYHYWELCTDESHNASSTHDSHSCWDYIKYYYPAAVEVHGAPDPGPSVGPGATVVWHYPDLFVRDDEMSINPPNANEGDELAIALPIHNSERLVSSTVTVRFYLDSVGAENLIHTAQLSLAGTESTTASFKWRATGGSHTIIGIVDPDNTVRELNEMNNSVSKTVVVNSRPRISPALTGFASDEDVPIVARMTSFASDPEDPQTSLRWSVARYDSRHLASVSSEPNQTLVFTPVPNWYGTTLVTISVSDSRNLASQKEINLTFNAVNDLPTVSEPTLSRSWVLRGQTVELSADGRDIESSEEDLTAIFEWRPPGSDHWLPLEATFDGARFRAPLTVPSTTPLGKADVRLALMDPDGQQGEWSYLNSSLEIQNNRPVVKDFSLSDESIIRGGVLSITLNASDVESPARELRPALQCSCAGGDWRSLDAEGEYYEGVWRFRVEVNSSWPVGIYDFRARVLDSDGGESGWLELSQSLRVENALPFVETARLSRTRALRGESALITVTGGDYESELSSLTLEVAVLDSKNRHFPGFISEINSTGGRWEVLLRVPLTAITGRYRLELRIGDSDGDWSPWYTSLPQLEVVNNLPAASFTCPAKVRQGELVWFDASNSSDVESELALLSLIWSFGDGTGGASGVRVSHVFERSGTFRVTLTITDRDGAVATSEKIITVEPRPEDINPGAPRVPVSLVTALVGVAVLLALAGVVMWRRRKDRSGG